MTDDILDLMVERRSKKTIPDEYRKIDKSRTDARRLKKRGLRIDAKKLKI